MGLKKKKTSFAGDDLRDRMCITLPNILASLSLIDKFPEPMIANNCLNNTPQ